MDQEEIETHDHILTEDDDDRSNGSEGMHLDSNGDTLPDFEDEPLTANELDNASANGVGTAATNVGLHTELDGVIVPKVGMVFASVEEAYDFYNNYARKVGFSVRKQRTNKSKSVPGKIHLQSLCCSCEGFYTMVKPPKKKRKEKRFGCKAMFEICIFGDNKYMLTKFVAEHNHELVPTENSHTLRSQKKSKPSLVGVNNKVQSSILQQSEIFSHIFTESSRAPNVRTDQSSCNNTEEYSCDEFIKMSDAQSLLDFFKQKKRENKHFVYCFQTTEDYKIRGLFFCDAKSRRDYGLFGDAVCVDTSLKTNDYNLVAVLILGVNSHGQTTLFGCGMLNGETADGFVWLFTTFLEAMGKKKPNTILTNQSIPIMNAISDVFPDIHHKSNPWYIYQDATKQFAQLAPEFKTLAQRFKECIYNSGTVEEFEKCWSSFLEKFGLRDNEWLQGFYDSRQTLVQVYSHGHFCAGMTILHKSESINKFLKTFFSSTLKLREFIDQYAKAVSNRREKEKEAEKETHETLPSLLSNWSIEREAANKYTNRMFYTFQGEYKLTLDQRLQLERDDAEICIYRVTEMEGRRRSHTVTYNKSDSSVSCTCRNFEFHGILCSHGLKVFRDLEVTSLPIQYYLKRWTSGATDEIVYDSYGEAIQGDIDPVSTARYNKLSRMAQKIVIKGAKSAEIYSLVKSGMLELEAKMEAFLISEEQQMKTSQKNTSGTNDDAISSSDEDRLLRDARMKRYRDQCDEKAKSKLNNRATKKSAPSKQTGHGEGNLAMPQMIGGASNMYRPPQELYGLPHPSQMPPWYLPYNFIPDQRYRPIFPKINISQQAPSAHTHVPQRPPGNIPRPPVPSVPHSSKS